MQFSSRPIRIVPPLREASVFAAQDWRGLQRLHTPHNGCAQRSWVSNLALCPALWGCKW